MNECPWPDIVEFFSDKSIERRKKEKISILVRIGSSRIYFYEESQKKHHYLDGGALDEMDSPEEFKNG